METIIKMNRKKILKDIKDTVWKVSPGATIILYGSEARGDSKSGSDVDILILVNKEILSYQDIASIIDPIYDIELKTGVLISPLVYTQKQWEDRPIKTPFYINVINEGIRL